MRRRIQQKISKVFFAGSILGMILLGSISVFAERLSYDRYAKRYDPRLETGTTWKDHLLSIPAYPFRLIKWPTDKALIYIEKNYIDKKVLWVYDRLRERGVTPHLNVVNPSKIGAGVDFDFMRLARQKHRYPDVVIRGGVHYTMQTIFETYGTAGWERIADSGWSFVGHVNYEDRMQEHFYGIGPASSAGDGFVYGMETLKLEQVLSYEWGPFYRAETRVAYQKTDVGGGRDGGRGQIGEGIFSSPSIQGLDGDNILSWAFQLMRDTRNQKENSTRGGFQRFKVGYNEGLGGSDARYWKYETELAQYISLGTDRRVLALHFYGEHNDEAGDHIIPFYDLALLGGYGAKPRRSHPLRGFDYNRFTDSSTLLFNIEYRYNIWQYRHFKMDTVAFFDWGQVFDEFSEFKFRDFRESYGGGFRLSIANIPLLSIELAHSEEGANFYVKSKAPF